jgi:mono/diheme cytochrome c family protein
LATPGARPPSGGIQDLGRFRQAVLTAALALATLAAGCGSSSGVDRARLLRGKLHYLSTCSRCHQPDGRGFAQIYPNLDGNPIVQGKSPEAVIDIVLHGRGDMPSFGSRPPDELAAIITYIRQAWSNHASAVTPSQVK